MRLIWRNCKLYNLYRSQIWYVRVHTCARSTVRELIKSLNCVRHFPSLSEQGPCQLCLLCPFRCNHPPYPTSPYHPSHLTFTHPTLSSHPFTHPFQPSHVTFPPSFPSFPPSTFPPSQSHPSFPTISFLIPTFRTPTLSSGTLHMLSPWCSSDSSRAGCLPTLTAPFR